MELRLLTRPILLLLWLACFTLASPLLSHQPEDLPWNAKDGTMRVRRQSDAGFFAITGVTDTGVQPRLEIREMQKDADMFNVFVLGLQRFMQINQTEKLSYYQVAGVHGRPYISWDDGRAIPTPGSAGYCTHVSNLFLTWHRAYLLLVEQVLFDNIIDVVNEFPAGAVRQRYASAAIRCRLPYWDWAAPPADGQNYPAIIQSSTITVTMPNGTNTIPNPLYSYKFHPVSEADFFFNPWGSWPDTLRNPTNMTSLAVSNNNGLGPTLNNLRNGMMNRLYNLFSFYSNYTQFGNEAWELSNVRNADSLESLHAVIHNTVGNQGHMTYFDYSAFDPVFWLHHVMIDRCFALWQAVYPNSRMESRTAVAATFSIQPGDPEDPTTPLDPFHKDTQGNLYTSVDMWDHKQYGYTYPELTGDTTPRAVTAIINRLYGSNATTGGIIARAKASWQAASKAEVAAAPGAVVDGRYRKYLANVVSQKFALNGSYAVFLFLGDPGDDPTQWSLSPNLVGVHDVFAGLQDPGMSAHIDIKVAGSVPLTDGLLNKVSAGELAGMDGDTVATYLHGNMQWRCAMLDGTPVDAEAVPDLSVTVVSAEMMPAASADTFPTWSNFKELQKATDGRGGGYSQPY